jgi:hypothetical protein
MDKYTIAIQMVRDAVDYRRDLNPLFYYLAEQFSTDQTTGEEVQALFQYPAFPLSACKTDLLRAMPEGAFAVGVAREVIGFHKMRQLKLAEGGFPLFAAKFQHLMFPERL